VPNDQLNDLKKEVRDMIFSGFSGYSEKTKAYWDKAENAEKTALQLKTEVRLIQYKINLILALFFLSFVLVLVGFITNLT
jgi:hypothetical protein